MMDRGEAVEHWRYLFSIAYRMLGAVHEAEDVVQEAYARWVDADPPDVEAPRAYLATIVTRLSIDRLRSAASKRETYIGPWLPEPLLIDAGADPADGIDPDSLSMAFLVVLESLTPVERAVFLLREVFGYEYAEIARIVDRSDANVRQIAHRARGSVGARRPRFRVPPERRRAVVERFVAALQDADIDTMLELLSDDVAVRSDGGGKANAARKPVFGAERVAAFLLGIARTAPPGVSVDVVDLNGQPGVIARLADGTPLSALVFEVRDGRIDEIFAVVNPDKLAPLEKEGSA